MSTEEKVDFQEECSSKVEGEAYAFIDVKKMFRKVDTWVLPIMIVTYSMQFMDKLALSAGSVFGVRKDLGLHGEQYSWCSSVFYFGYLLGNFIVTRLIQRVPIGKMVGISLCFWGIVLACSAACQTYGQLIACRFLQGLLESVVSPSFVFMTSMWWAREQQPARTGMWFAGNDIGGIVSSFVSFGLGHITGGSLSPWRYIFIVYGCIAFLWSFYVFFFLPDTPQNARFLSDSEKDYYKENLVQSYIAPKWDWNEAKHLAMDLHFWFLLFSSTLAILPNSGMLSYSNIVLTSFGFTSIQSTLVGLPSSILAGLFIAGTGQVCSRWKNQRTNMMIVCCLLSIIGGALLYAGKSKGVKLTGYYFVTAQPALFPLGLSMAASNFIGTTRRSIVNSSIFIVYCACNIGGPQLFRSKDYPKYSYAFRSWIICYALGILMALVIRAHCMMINKKQEAKDQTAVPESITDGILAHETMDPTFRYMY
ncbi:hypothetical protein CANARDRAFT_176857 [[Candida] arabinofermentans NRRL YB-2248]|uniref:Major facilitator superfamily (MFS) profile domain-containing protein n=1 Tax=[Candida] arabinofermentans NRRL YB-2248 TaxID=983967 RepID=A0A1E4SYQ2_9ASCO|nr:hypothetical protein CANARDRAFT_176857 [[Candida] arabinofermentans NRRL YB-2248]